MLKINTIVGRPRPTAADLLQQAYQLQAIAYRLFGGCGRGCAKWSARVIRNWLLILNTRTAIRIICIIVQSARSFGTI